MKVLVIGSGGREHALATFLFRSSYVSKLYCAPGNAGISEIAECINIDAEDIKGLVQFAKEKEIDLTVVGPEAPLAKGIVDAFKIEGLKIFGPTKAAASIEASKVFAKNIMLKYGVPTGEARVFNDFKSAITYVKDADFPLVVKADGLAQGKGVSVCFDAEKAYQALENCFVRKKFGRAGEQVLIEEYLEGEELSLLAFSDGKEILPMVPAQDYKRAYDEDEGPNTGGMGSYSPVPQLDKKTYNQIVETILKPTIYGLASEGIEYKGVLYGGLILTKEGPKVLEFNVRFGDPETQAILPRLKSDLGEIVLKVVEGNLSGTTLEWREDKCVTVVAASSGYPESYETGFEIKGIERAKAGGVEIFHAGTALSDGKIITSGGRVLNVSALGKTFREARERAYTALEKIHFDGIYYRKDIGLKAVSYEEKMWKESVWRRL